MTARIGRRSAAAASRRARIHATRSGVTRYGKAPSASVAARSVIRSRSAATSTGGEPASARGPPVDRGAVGLEVVAHPGQRPVELVAVQAGRHVRVADAEAEDEATAGRLGEGLGRHARGLRVVAPDADDARAEDQAGRLGGQQAEQGERLPPDRLGHPQRP